MYFSFTKFQEVRNMCIVYQKKITYGQLIGEIDFPLFGYLYYIFNILVTFWLISSGRIIVNSCNNNIEKKLLKI